MALDHFDPAHDWQTCDGTGRRADEGFRAGMSRRGLIMGIGLGALGWAAPALGQITVNPSRKDDNVLVVLFLRGGADGLSLVVPYGDEAYYRHRPNLGIPRKATHDLNGFFGLHPSLSPLLPLYESGQMAVVHAVGSHDQTHSHFEAMDTVERGAAAQEGPSSGWIARYLRETEHQDDSPLRAVAFGSILPAALIGATGPVALESLQDYRLDISDESLRQLALMYGSGKDEVSLAGRKTLEVLKSMERLATTGDAPRHGAIYPDSSLGQGLKQTAQLVKSQIGLEVACLDKGGWDTHVAQGTATVGWLPTLLDDLAKSLAAFATDLGDRMDRVTVVVMSEFGRRIAENSGLGTDHGHGGAMFLIGGGVKGGRVHAKWNGLAHSVGPGDVPVTTDYRDVLAEVVQRRLRSPEVSSVFQGHRQKTLGLVS